MNAETQRIPRPAQFALAALGVVVLAVAGWFLLVRPKRAEAARTEARIVEVRKEIADRRAASTARQVRAAVKTADLFKLAKAMPNDENMAAIILELNSVAEEAGIVFESITPQSPVPSDGYAIRPIALQFRGNFYTLSDFLFRLRQLVQVRDGLLTTTGRLFTVDMLSFTEDPERGFPFITADLTIDAFVFGQAPGTTATPPVAGSTSTEPTGTTGTTTTSTTETTTTATSPQPEVAQSPSGGSAAPTPTPSS